MRKRIRVTVRPMESIGKTKHPGWGFTLFGRAWWYPTKSMAVQAAARDCRNLLRDGHRSELVVKNRNGRISGDKRTYGADPRKIRG